MTIPSQSNGIAGPVDRQRQETFGRMITKEQQLAARNAAEGKRIQVRYLDIQPGVAHIKPMPLFNVVSGDYAVGSTITLATAFRLGLKVEVIE